jgi:signal peptidase I
MSTNDPDDRFRLPPLEGVFDGARDDGAPDEDDPHDLPLLPVDEADVTEGPSGDAVLNPVEPEDLRIDDEPEPVEPSETEALPFTGIAQALEVVEQLDVSDIGASENGSEPPSDIDAFDEAASAADERVFAAAASDIAAERPDYGIAELELPTEAAVALKDEEISDEMWPHFLRADEANTALQEQSTIAAPVVELELVKEKPKPTVARTLAEIPVLLLVAAVIAFLVKSFLAQAYYIPSGSMIPQLQIDDRVVVSKLAYKAHDPHRGDIIVFDDPRTGNSTTSETERTGVSKWVRKVGEGIGVIQPSTDEFIKRVIGLPGETVEGHDGSVYVNGKKLIEPYLPQGVETSDFPPQTIESGRLWVMGDNRTGSADSRVFGQIKISTIVGRAVIKVWPFSSISFL